MPRAPLPTGIEIEYEVHGEGDPLLLIMGIDTQLVHWPIGLVELFVEAGFQVIRFDNRDRGKSTKLKHLGAPPLWPLVMASAFQVPVNVPYHLDDMALDAKQLLDHLNIDKAHVLGASMGGMIAQVLALNHPEKLSSLNLLFTSGGGTYIPSLRGLKALLAKRPTSRAEASQRMLAVAEILCGPRENLAPHEFERIKEIGAQAWDRDPNPDQDGFLRQFAAIARAPKRFEQLKSLQVPTTVIHGDDDPLIPLRAGRAIAEVIPHAKLHVISRLGHFLPSRIWPLLVNYVQANAERSKAPDMAKA